MNHHITLNKLKSTLGNYCPNFEKMILEYLHYYISKKNLNIFKNMKSIDNLIPIKINLEDNPKYVKRINGCRIYGNIIYSKSLKQLEKYWFELNNDTEFKPGFYHLKLYELAKQRFNLKNKSKYKSKKSNISNTKNKSRKIKK
jgi:hypothetical protein